MNIYEKAPGVLYARMEPTDKKNAFSSLITTATQSPLLEIRIDLKDVYYLASENLADMMSLKKSANAKNIRIVLLNMDESIHNIFEMTNMLPHFALERDLSSYSNQELMELFYRQDEAEDASAYIAANYSDEFRTLLVGAFDSDDAIIQEYAVLTMGRAHSTDLIPLLRKAMDSTYPNVARAAIQVLGWMGDDASKDRFYQFLISDSPVLAEAAAAAIAMVSDDSDAKRLMSLSESHNPYQRMYIAGTLSLINGPEAFAILERMVEREKDAQVRRVLVNRVSFFNMEGATKILIASLDDPERQVQETAAAGLARTGLRGHEEAITSKMSSGDRWVAYFAIKALGQSFTAKTAEHLMALYPDAEQNVKLAIMQVIGFSQKEVDVSDFLARHVNDENEDIRKEALFALSKSAPQIGIQKAYEVLEKDPSWLVRYKAVEVIESAMPEGYKTVLDKAARKEENRYVKEKISALLGIKL